MSDVPVPSTWAGQQGKKLRQALRAFGVLSGGTGNSLEERIAALESKSVAEQATLDDHETRITALENP